MFDVAAEEITQLNDTDLRELVGRLCEAEVVSHGLSPAAVTWGGNQTAADGGLDVRVALPAGTSIEGFIPRRLTGFQVKTPDMPRAAILTEMRPTGLIRPAIQELANDLGAYVIVSSKGSTADSALRNRREALREALNGVSHADQLHTDFYDRTRLATWVRRHPGIVTWVKEKVRQGLVGWRSYGPWSSAAEAVDADYLLDGKLRLHLGKHRDAATQPVADAIDELRDELAHPRKVVRLVGLSGVGKTRLVQALFDTRIGSRSLPPSLAVYTNLSDNPNPQPTALASDLIANGTRAILIVDNCPPELHRRLSELCAASASTVSLLTVEYDVRDDQPEGTQVVTLDTSSPDLIEKLIARRYPHLSQVDARTIADASGGNARIAIALAETVERSETIAGLSDEELFQRLFRQRNDQDNALLQAAQACSLVYSFQGETLTGVEAELPHLAVLADQTPRELYRHVSELLRRDLVQQRSVWRAVLPHAIANRLAARALEDIPYDLIDQQLVTGGTERLARSFSRRLSFLHDHPQAIAIVERWLAPGGFLGDVRTFSDLGRAMFENAAPVLPEAALKALERANEADRGVSAIVWRRHRQLLRSLAYDPPLFERAASIMVRAATQSTEEREAKEASDIFVSLFTIYLSGTHATIEQRIKLIEQLLRSGELKQCSLGLTALGAMLKATHFSSGYRFEFGARSRDYGYLPQSNEDMTRWYGAALALMERLAFVEGIFKPELRDLLARNFHALWTSVHIYDELESLARKFAEDGFWRAGWAACRQAMRFNGDRLTPAGLSKLNALEAELRPTNLAERVRAVVLGDRSSRFDLEEIDVTNDFTSASARLEANARELGAAVAADEVVLSSLLLDLLRGGNRTWSFGRGLAGASEDRRATWAKLVDGFEQISTEQRDTFMLRGYLAELWEQDRDLAQDLLDASSNDPALVVHLTVLHSAVQFDARGVERLKRALKLGLTPVSMYRNLAYGRATDNLPGHDLKDLLLLIADQPHGVEVAQEILFMRLYSDRSESREHDPELVEVGRRLLQCVSFKRSNQHEDLQLGGIVRASLVGQGAGQIAGEVAMRLRSAVAAYETSAFDNDDLLKALFEVQPVAALDALFAGDERDRLSGVDMFDDFDDHRANPADAISCEVLVAWCEQDPGTRYALAASIITYARRAEEGGLQIWSEQAKALLRRAPDPKIVLAAFVNRFKPMSWSGSRASLWEANVRLLDCLGSEVSTELIGLADEAKAQVGQQIAGERQRETDQDRVRDERFE